MAVKEDHNSNVRFVLSLVTILLNRSDILITCHQPSRTLGTMTLPLPVTSWAAASWVFTACDRSGGVLHLGKLILFE